MIAVIFEVWPADGRKQTYLDIAAKLKPELEQIDGFLSIERFQSLVDDRKLLSLSFWRDEEAVKAWRNVEHHRQAQAAGRGGVLRDYRLRVAARGARLRHDRARRGAGRFARKEWIGRADDQPAADDATCSADLAVAQFPCPRDAAARPGTLVRQVPVQHPSDPEF